MTKGKFLFSFKQAKRLALVVLSVQLFCQTSLFAQYDAGMKPRHGFTSEAVNFSVDKEQGQMLVVCGSPLKQPFWGALWLIHNNGPETIEAFDDHNKTEVIQPGTDALFLQAGDVNLAVRLQGTRLTTGTIRLVKTQPWNDAQARQVYLRGHGSVSCTSLAPVGEGRGHWAITYLTGTVTMDIRASHPSGPGGGANDLFCPLAPNHDGRPRTIIVYKPAGKELSLHLDTNAIGSGGEIGVDNYVWGSFLFLQNDVYE